MMLLAWNTLQEASEYLAEETQEIWNEREVLQACLSFGIFPKLQILARDRNDIPSWMIEGEMAELPFNLDLLSFLAGDGRVKLVRYDGLLYRFTPSLLVGIESLRLSKDDLVNLLNDICEKKYNGVNLRKDIGLEILPEGRIPATSIGKVAIAVANEIKQGSGIIPTAKDVMAKLRSYAQNGEKHSEVLRPSPDGYRGNGVYWITGTLKEKEFSLEACQKMLMKYLPKTPIGGE